MKRVMKHLISVSAVLGLVLSSTVLAQHQEKKKPGRILNARSPDVRVRQAVQRAGANLPRPGGVPNVGGTAGNRPNPGAGQPNGRPAGFSRPAPNNFRPISRHRNPYYWRCPSPSSVYPGAGRYGVSPANWYGFLDYLGLISSRYRGFRGLDVAYRFAAGDSALTAESVQLATREAAGASEALVNTTVALQRTIDDYDHGLLTRDEFEKAVDEQTDQIRDLAKKVRDDHLLGFVDVRQETKLAVADKARSVAELKELAQSLYTMAVELDESVREFSAPKSQLTQVVSLDHLERPSVSSLSKGIDKLAKRVENSADKL